MAIKFTAKDELKTATGKTGKAADAPVAYRENAPMDAPGETAAPPTAPGADLFDPTPDAPARKRKRK